MMSDTKSGTLDGRDQNFNSLNMGVNSAAEPTIQQPGELIAPEVTQSDVTKAAEEIYGLQIISCRQMNGYDDKNYHLVTSGAISNPHLSVAAPEGYVLKIINSMDTRRPELLHAQIAFMNHLRARGIGAQEPLPDKNGDLVAFYTFPAPDGKGEGRRHAVCLRSFMPGKILADVTLTPDLCYQVGQFLGKMSAALQDFDHRFYDTFDCLWSMNNIPKLSEFTHAVTDPQDRRLVEEIIAEFSRCVLPRRGDIRQGFVHGDPNEQNIIVIVKDSDSQPPSSLDHTSYVISGVLDYQDVARTHPLYDLAMSIAYVMLTAKTFDPLEVGGHMLAGYTSQLALPALERALLKTAVASRLVQSLVLGAYTHSLDPTNHYVLTTAARGWPVLRSLWATPTPELDARWSTIQASYDR